MIQSIAFAFIPIVTSFYLMVSLHAVMGLFGGIVNVFCNVVLVYIWGDKVGPFMQALHFCVGVGSVIAPLVISAVTSVVSTESEVFPNSVHVSYWIFAAAAIATAVMIIFSPKMDASNNVSPSKTPRTKKRLTLKELAAKLTFPLRRPKTPYGEEEPKFSYVPNKQEQPDIMEAKPQHKELEDVVEGGKVEGDIMDKPQEKVEEVIEDEQDTSLVKKVIITLLTAAALFFYVGIEVGYGGLIYTYVRMKDLTDEAGASLVNSEFWLSFTVGRLVAIPLSGWLRPSIMLVLDVLGVFLAIAVLLTFNNSLVMVCIGTAILGASMASQFPATISLPKTHMGIEVSGAMTGVMVIGAAFGEMVIPLCVTTSFKVAGPDGLMWSLLIMCSIAAVLYAVLLIVFRNKKAVEQSKESKSEWAH
ncbi:hypothetical protein AKO1_010412 [Acrasis kona]|uniref:Uncharacterized protein n=1 Tax=Acrasis kona TaxID=1008807 RepID=A0AAW2ZKR3_9EUKA